MNRHTRYNRLPFLAAGAGLLFMGWAAFAQDAATPPPDKAGVVTKQSKADRDLTAKIRRAITADKSLSTRAHNVTVLTRAGKVTLRGNVASEADRDAVLAKAKEIAGADNVTDNLTVAPAKNPKKTTGG